MNDVDQTQPRDVDSVNGAGVEVIGDERFAVSLIGVLSDPAGAEHPARAGLEESALELVDSALLLGSLASCDHG